MSGSPKHLQKLKSRLSLSHLKSERKMSQREKVDQLESTIKVFRAEVDMKLKIMQQILSNRNEQVAVHKRLLEKEHDLYNTLLVHWANSRKVAASGISVNFSHSAFSAASHHGKENLVSDDVDMDEDDEEELHLEEEEDVPSDSDYMETTTDISGTNAKKSKSLLRRERNSAKSMGIRYPKRGAVDHKHSTVTETDEFQDGDDPTFQLVEGDEDDVGSDEDYAEVKNKTVLYQRKDPVWFEFECMGRDPKSRRMTAAACKKCGKIYKWPKPVVMKSHLNKCVPLDETRRGDSETIIPNPNSSPRDKIEAEPRTDAAGGST